MDGVTYRLQLDFLTLGTNNAYRNGSRYSQPEKTKLPLKPIETDLLRPIRPNMASVWMPLPFYLSAGICLACIPSLSRATDPPGDSSGDFKGVDFNYTSEYNFRGIKKAQNCFDPDVFLKVDGLYFDLLTDQAVTKHINDEIDFSAKYQWKFVGDSLLVEPVATYYWYPEAHSGLGQTEHTFETGVGIRWDSWKVKPSIAYYHDFRLKSDTVEGRLGYSFPTRIEKVSFDTGIFAGSVDSMNLKPDASGPPVRGSYSYYGSSIKVLYRYTNAATISVGIYDTGTRNLVGTGTANESQEPNNAWFTCGVSITF